MAINSTQIPNSNNLFDIYQAELKSMDDLNNYMIKGKFDRKYYKTLKYNISHTKQILEMLNDSMNVLFSKNRLFTKESIEATKNSIQEFTKVITSVFSLNSIIGGERADISIRTLKRNLRSTREVITLIYNSLESMTSKNFFNIFNKNLIKNMGDSLNEFSSILKDMADLNNYIQNVKIGAGVAGKLKMKLLMKNLQSLFNGVEKLASFNIGIIGTGTANVKLINNALDDILDLCEPLNKIPLKRLIQTKIAIRRMRSIMKGFIKLVETVGSIPSTTFIMGTINMMLMGKAMDGLSGTIDAINRVSLIKLFQSRIRMKRIEKILFGQDEKDVEFAIFGKSFSYTKRSKPGMIGLVRMMGNMSPLIFAKAFVNITLLNHFLNSLSASMMSLQKVSLLKIRQTRFAVQHIETILFGYKYGFMRRKSKKKTWTGMLGLAKHVGSVNPLWFASAFVNISLLSAFYKVLMPIIYNISKVGILKIFKARRVSRRLSAILFGTSYGLIKGKGGGLFQLVSRAGRYNPAAIAKGSVNLVLMYLGTFRIGRIVTKLALMLPLTAIAWLTVKMLVPIMRGLVQVFLITGRHKKQLLRTAKIFNKLSESITKLIVGLALVGLLITMALPAIALTMLVVTGIVMMFMLLGRHHKGIWRGILIMSAIGMTLLLLAADIALLAIAINDVGWEGVGQILAIIGGLVLVYSLAGVLAGVIAVGSLAMILVGISLMSMVIPVMTLVSVVKTLKELNISTDEFVEIATSPVKAMAAIAASVADIPMKNLLAAVPKFIMLRMIVGSIGKMASVMQKVSSLSIPTEFDRKGKGTKWVSMTANDFTRAAANAASIAGLFAALFGDKATNLIVDGKSVTINPIKQEYLNNISNKTKRKMRQLRKIVSNIGDMANTLARVSKLVVPDETKGYDEKGNPKGWKQISAADFANASSNIGNIMTFMINAVVSNADKVEDIKRRNMKKIKLALESVSPVSGMVDTVVNIAQGRFPKTYDANGNPTSYQNFNSLIKGFRYQAMGQNKKQQYVGMHAIKYLIRDVMTIGISAVNMISESELSKASKRSKKLVQPMEILNDYISSLSNIRPENADAYERSVNNTIKMIDKTNGVDLAKLKYMYSLTAKLAEFSKSINGNFDRLANTINDKLITALEKLEKVLKETNDKIPDGKESTSTPAVSLARITSARTAGTPEPIKRSDKDDRRAKAANSELSGKLDNLVASIENLIEDMSTGIVVKPARNTVWPEA